VRQLRAHGHAEQIRQSTGLVVDPYFSATKLRWLLDNVPGAHLAAAQASCLRTIDSWLLWNSPAAGCTPRLQQRLAHHALRPAPQRLDHELLKLLHVPDSVLPQVFASAMSTRTEAELFGASIPIAASPATSRARCSARPAPAGWPRNTYGTGCFMLMHTGTQFRSATTA